MYEELLNEIYKKYARGVFVDVGAGEGQTLLKVSGLGIHYVGFEPQLKSFAHVKSLIFHNKVNGTVYPIALSNESKLTDLYILDECLPTASIIRGFRPPEFYDRSEKVPAHTGDSFEILDVGFIKIDAEGSELEVIEGFLGTIRDQNPYITFEVLPHYLSWGKKPLNDNIIKFREERLSTLETIIRETHTIHQITNKGVVEVCKILPGSTADLSNINYLAKPRKIFH
jgi:FkbM family methyltransferase